MNWITDFVQNKLEKSSAKPKEIKDNWHKDPITAGIISEKQLKENCWVFPSGFHARINAEERLEMMLDNKFTLLESQTTNDDPIKFRDSKKYTERLSEARKKTKHHDALISAMGTINGAKAVVSVMDFEFMAGSMGSAVGVNFYNAAMQAIKNRSAFVCVTASGGARMQEGIISLMQLPRTTIAVQMVKRANLPYIVILTDPTTGGVSASFAMLGDVHIAEPGSLIGFAGKRVIEQTVREQLPTDFQTAEYLLTHGMVDMVVERKELKSVLGRLINMLLPQ